MTVLVHVLINFILRQQGFPASLLYFQEIDCVTFKIMIFESVQTYGIWGILAVDNRSGCWPKNLYLYENVELQAK